MKAALLRLQTWWLLQGWLWGALFWVLLSPGPVHATGMRSISRDTVWSGQIELADEVYVRPGVTLVVLPGTTVRFAKAPGAGDHTGLRLIVRGTLIAQGRPDAPIVFTSAAAQAQPGDWSGILLDNSKSTPNRLSFCRIEYAYAGLQARIADLRVEDSELLHNLTGVQGQRQLGGGLWRCRLVENGTGLSFQRSSGLRIENSQILHNREAGAVFSAGSTAVLAHNEIADNGIRGIACYQGSSPEIVGNRIYGQKQGIYLELKSNPIIQGNDITANGSGIWAEKLVAPKITGNRISGNEIGITCNYSAYPEIHHNQFLGNTRFALVLGDNQSIAVEQQIPYRAHGQDFTTPQPAAPLPAKTRKPPQAALQGDGRVHAEQNWWGSTTTAILEHLGPEGNIPAIEDGLDKPDTTYQGQAFPRDRVAFAPWLDTPPPAPETDPSPRSGVTGKVVVDGAPAGGVRVHAYTTAQGAFQGEGSTFSAPTGAAGTFQLALAPGRYYLLAKGAAEPLPSHEPEEGEFFGYYGGNPVRVAQGALRPTNIAVMVRAPITTDTQEAADGVALLQGTVETPAGPLAGAQVHLYPDASRDFRGPDLFGPEGAVLGGTAADGSFTVEVPPGRYYLVASKRASGHPVGPLAVGDYHGYFDGNPVLLDPGFRTRIVIQVAAKLREAGAADDATDGLQGIRGHLRAAAGAVPPGAYAYASRSPQLMAGMMPPFRSRAVQPDGNYFIDLPAAGTYYVGARSGYGGPPLPGEWFGVYGGETPTAVTLQPDTIVDDIDVTIRALQ